MSMWLTIHNLLIICSLLWTAFVGYQYRLVAIPFKWLLVWIVFFFAVMMFLYIGSFVLTTTFFADRMVWIPFFYHDYNYHAFKSVTEYLNHENNYRELLELQLFSLLISSLMYFAAGSVGFTIKTMMDRARKASRMASSGS
jgi:hypothetical protein